jgi:hypothetical protein
MMRRLEDDELTEMQSRHSGWYLLIILEKPLLGVSPIVGLRSFRVALNQMSSKIAEMHFTAGDEPHLTAAPELQCLQSAGGCLAAVQKCPGLGPGERRPDRWSVARPPAALAGQLSRMWQNPEFFSP